MKWLFYKSLWNHSLIRGNVMQIFEKNQAVTKLSVIFWICILIDLFDKNSGVEVEHKE